MSILRCFFVILLLDGLVAPLSKRQALAFEVAAKAPDKNSTPANPMKASAGSGVAPTIPNSKEPVAMSAEDIEWIVEHREAQPKEIVVLQKVRIQYDQSDGRARGKACI